MYDDYFRSLILVTTWGRRPLIHLRRLIDERERCQ